MAISIAQMMAVAGPAAIRAKEKRYYLKDVFPILETTSYCTYMTDPETLNSVPIVWSAVDDIKNPTENDKIQLVRVMILNAIDVLDMLAAEQEETEEVIFETPNN